MIKRIALYLACAIALLVGLGTAGAAASSVKQTVDVYFRGISIWVNGNSVKTEAEPLVYQDRTYVPVRAVAEAMGADVSWDAEANRVVINGRVRLSVQQNVVEYCWHQNNCRHKINGLVMNDTGKTADSVAVSCKVFSADGVQVDQGTWTLNSSVPPGSSAFRMETDDQDYGTKKPEGKTASCEIEHVHFK